MKRNFLHIGICFVFLVISISNAGAAEIILDTAHHHIGDEFKEELNPANPEEIIYSSTFTLDPTLNIENAELILTGKSIFPTTGDEFLDKVYINNIEIGNLNDYIPSGTQDSAEVEVSIPVHPSVFNPGTNSIKISSGNGGNNSNYDDFEFYALSLNLIEVEPVTVAPPLKVAWTHKFPWRLIHGTPEFKFLTADGVLYICEDYYGANLTALDAETGKLLWKQEIPGSANLEYANRTLFLVYSSTVGAVDAKTGEPLWNQTYLNSWFGESLVFGKTLFVGTSDEGRIVAINTDTGTPKWEYEVNLADPGDIRNNNCFISGLQANGKLLVFKYEGFERSRGIIALNAKTGKEVWSYKNLREYSQDPLLYKNMVYVPGEEILALSDESGTEVWKVNLNQWIIGTEVKNNKLFIKTDPSGNSSYKFIVLDATNGNVLKYPSSPAMSVSSAASTDEYSYSTMGCKINVFNSSTGKPVWSSSRIKGASISEPILYKDILYLISADGVLYAFEHGDGGLFFTYGLEEASILYLPPIATFLMLFLLLELLRNNKNRNKALIFGSWIIALVAVLFLSFIAIQPYFIAWDIFGILTFLVLCSLALILLLGIAFLIYGIRKEKKQHEA